MTDKYNLTHEVKVGICILQFKNAILHLPKEFFFDLIRDVIHVNWNEQMIVKNLNYIETEVFKEWEYLNSKKALIERECFIKG